MRVYGIFDGVAKDNVVAVAAAPDFNAWRGVTGKSCPREYPDFLEGLAEGFESVDEDEDGGLGGKGKLRRVK
ncbi:hypothetical protein [Desulfothermobacter acidiphilus]|uniref:hypothetical protein n=1 Tax=Desulfothermobacter acidiphilus TaxID=1938353 RepID=UPI003F8A538D